MKTSDILIDCVYKDCIPPPSVLADYFGFSNIFDNSNITIIFGLYIGLIKNNLITSEQLHYNCINHTLDTFIRYNYEKLLKNNRQSQYYTDFCHKHLVIDTELDTEF